MLRSTRLTSDQQQDIQALQEGNYTTRRATVPALEEILYQALPVLDHGFVRIIDYMGDDNAIVQAARVSYGKGTKKVSEDKGLIHYLMRHRHSTPFEMCEIKFHVKMPLFVARQWLRHRTANVNEYSARYSILDREFYIPEGAEIATQATNNRQGRGAVLNPVQQEEVMALLKRDAQQCYETYTYLLNQDETGHILDETRDCLARELARMNLTLNYYTQFYWKIDLHNFMHFLSLRADGHAQYEIRVYAELMVDLLQRWVPLTYGAFIENRLKGVSFSASALEVIKKWLNQETVERKDTSLSLREWEELKTMLGKG